jgi:hypothetical protein
MSSCRGGGVWAAVGARTASESGWLSPTPHDYTDKLLVGESAASDRRRH